MEFSSTKPCPNCTALCIGVNPFESGAFGSLENGSNTLMTSEYPPFTAVCIGMLKLPRVFGSLINGSYSLITSAWPLSAAKLINLVVYPFTDIGPCICKAC